MLSAVSYAVEMGNSSGIHAQLSSTAYRVFDVGVKAREAYTLKVWCIHFQSVRNQGRILPQQTNKQTNKQTTNK
jgi:hypothetical protein